MKMAIAVESPKHPKNRRNYRVWYLNFNEFFEVTGVGTMTKDELIADIMSDIKTHNKSTWRAFLKDQERSVEIDLVDFLCQGTFDNTHFGNLPTLSEFQEVLDGLQFEFNLKSIA